MNGKDDWDRVLERLAKAREIDLDRIVYEEGVIQKFRPRESERAKAVRASEERAAQKRRARQAERDAQERREREQLEESRRMREAAAKLHAEEMARREEEKRQERERELKAARDRREECLLAPKESQLVWAMHGERRLQEAHQRRADERFRRILARRWPEKPFSEMNDLPEWDAGDLIYDPRYYLKRRTA